MRISRFARLIPLADSRVLAISTLFRSIVDISGPLADVLVGAIPGGQIRAHGRERKALCEARILVGDDADEEILFRRWLETERLRGGDVKATVTLTNRCNLRCTYCYEAGLARGVGRDMSLDTVQATCSWLRALARQTEASRTRICFYGGEPTLKPALIHAFANAMKPQIQAGSVSLSAYTNASVANLDLVGLVRETGIEHLQVTLDGPGAVHDRRRPTPAGRGSFATAYDNVRRLIRETRATVLIDFNFDADNCRAADELMVALEPEFLSDRLSIAFNPVLLTEHTCGDVRHRALPNESAAVVWAGLYGAAIRRRVPCVPLRLFDTGPCSYWRVGHVLIGTEGDVFKCVGMPGRGEGTAGNVSAGLTETQFQALTRHTELEAWDNSECLKCAWLPMCLGGCRFHRAIESGSIRGKYCRRELFELCECEILRSLALNGDLGYLTRWGEMGTRGRGLSVSGIAG